MAVTNRERVGTAFELLTRGLAPFVERLCQGRYGADWFPKVVKSGQAASPTDPYVQLQIISDQWNEIFREVLGRAERNYVAELREVRNRWAHFEPFSSDDAERALDTVGRLLSAVSAKDQAIEVERMRSDLRRVVFDEQARQTQRRAAAVPIEGQPAGNLHPWRTVVQPHDDVASGRYQQAEFMADLHQVWRDEGSDEYRKPREFFSRTFLTDGLKHLLRNATLRWRGEGGEPIVELQTSFGGGKTHSLIALYHLAKGHPAATLPGIEAMLSEAGLGAPPPARTAVLVGQRITPGSVERKSDGTEVRTLWGELAWQLGGPEGYAIVADADATATNPGEALVALLRRYSPCLVLIDEWVAYARQLWRDDSLPAGTFDTQFTFAQTLAEAARAVPWALLVVSIPASDIEFGGQGGQEALTRLRNVLARAATTWRPASADEGFEIVRRRLFQPVSPEAAPHRDAVVRAFASLYRTQRSEFPVNCAEADYERRLRAAYPIHPQVFDQLYGEWSSLDKFQQTRGVLRLMAAAVQQLWERSDASLLILPAAVPIDAAPVLAELTRYLGDEWRPIIETEVDGPSALPLTIDRQSPSTLGRFSATRRVARTIYMGSAPIQKAANRGIDDRAIKLGCVQPAENPGTFVDALRRLSGQATHLYQDQGRHWYSTQPSVAALARDRAQSHVTDEAVLDEIRDRLRPARQSKGSFMAFHAAPTGPEDVPDEEAGVRLVVLGPDRPHVVRSQESPAVVHAATILQRRSPTANRVCANMLVFVAPDRPRLEDLKQAARDYLAWKSLDDDKETLNIENLGRRLIRDKLAEWDQTVELRIGEAYQWALVPRQAPADPTVAWKEVRINGTGTLAGRVWEKLVREEDLLPVYGGIRLRMELDHIPLWEGDHVGVRKLWDHFARYLYLPRLRDASVLLGAVADGVGCTTWDPDTFAYASAFDESTGRYLGLVTGRQPSALLDGDAVVVRPEAAHRQQESEPSPEPGPAEPDDPFAPSPTDGGGGAVSLPAGPERFFGRAQLDPVRLVRDLGTINEEIIQRLQQVPGAQVRIAIEITADAANGFNDDAKRVIGENARTLRFHEHVFESGS